MYLHMSLYTFVYPRPAHKQYFRLASNEATDPIIMAGPQTIFVNIVVSIGLSIPSLPANQRYQTLSFETYRSLWTPDFHVMFPVLLHVFLHR